MPKLFNDAYNSTRTNGSSAFTDSETKTLLHSYWMNQLYGHLYVIARHTHLNTRWQIANASNVSCSEVELWTIVVEERSMTAALVLCQNVNLSGKLVVALNRTWLAQTLSSFDFSSLNATQQSADVVASLSLVKQLTEHLDTSNNALTNILMDTDDFNFVIQVQSTTLYSTGSNSTTAGNGKYVFYRHQEWLVCFTNWVWYPRQQPS